MLDRLFPERLDNAYRGREPALWLFGLVSVMKGAQSVAMIVGRESIAQGADGIPLTAYPPGAARSVVAALAQGSVWRLFFCLACLVVLWRYRSAVPLMFTLFALNYLAAQAVLHLAPLDRTGSPVGPWVNLALFVVMLVGLALSLWRRPGSVAR